LFGPISDGAIANAMRRLETPLEAERDAIRAKLRVAEMVWKADRALDRLPAAPAPCPGDGPVSDMLIIDAASPSGSSSSGPLPALAGFTALGAHGDPFATVDVVGAPDPVDPILTGSLIRFGTDGSVLELLFETTADATGPFGPSLLMVVETGAAAPLGGVMAFPTSPEIATPIPPPPWAALLGTAPLGGWPARRRGGRSR
jgi:hypothetical protein